MAESVVAVNRLLQYTRVGSVSELRNKAGPAEQLVPPLPPLPSLLSPPSPLPSSTATWTLDPPEDATGWRHIRVRQNGPNASGQTQYLSVSGLELYGEVHGLADQDLGEGERVSAAHTVDTTGQVCEDVA